MTTTVPRAPDDHSVETRSPRELLVTKAPAERAFLGLTRGSALIVLGVIALVGLFLTIKALPAIRVAKFSFLTTQAWEPDIHHFGIAGIMTDTILIAVVAVVIAIPIALGLALYITEVAPAPIRRTLVSLVDLMAAVPSVVYGLWALQFLQNRTVVGVSRWLATWFGWIPFFHVERVRPGQPGPVGVHLLGIHLHRRDRRVAHGDPHPVLGHARVVLPGAARRARGRLRARSHPVGDDPLGGPAVRQGRDHRRDDARARSGPR